MTALDTGRCNSVAARFAVWFRILLKIPEALVVEMEEISATDRDAQAFITMCEVDCRLHVLASSAAGMPRLHHRVQNLLAILAAVGAALVGLLALTSRPDVRSAAQLRRIT